MTCAADVIQTVLILNKLGLVRQNLCEEMRFRVCKLPARVRFCLRADSLCLCKVRKKGEREKERKQSHELNEASAWQGV